MHLLKRFHPRFFCLGLATNGQGKLKFSSLLPFLLMVVGIYCFLNFAWPQRFLLPAFFGESVFCVNSPDKVLALTFDDGPDPVYTIAIAETLLNYEAKGTFFVLGKHSQKYPQIVQYLAKQGHEIANHTWNHNNLNSKFSDLIYWEIAETDNLIHELGYSSHVYFRPPFGRAGLFVTKVLRRMQKPMIFWDVDLQDWRGNSTAEMMNIFEHNFHNGSIILLHDSDGVARGGVYANRENTVEVVEEILSAYTPLGYEFVTISELLNRGTIVRAKNLCLKR
ncbi:polysaccharide deacetylase family protein [Umezakia ovalisporum]|uniref:Polysaccharide deacetylase family protein n=2 Tax=Umezakia ovalisporum TaxID=75695 RepID=A0ABT6K3U6_9CYAN|nr:polysaccharide deacetylase family protein [Umezakia ovalisporum]MBI1240082.1 polysaccharide deacetylase family protein [Nostoc sp. RI_552]MDH6056994.1 polysaccharide deacetylase family protein [Umezakia ovalisporum FSS-43]MDH6068444.1 polysaccharide deacetylase family protein [Umezakia ovalisporum APH033B]MDH6071185.1 polysaccharide deacetylase family protein [Umezakia ovalisporum CobakiLakeA]MDH6074791.1 polysaccharide deacetylase family protein [Umezakia ovalisporum CS-1034]